MGNGSESKQVLTALNDRLRGKPEGEREFTFRNSNEACEGLGLRGRMRTRTVAAMLEHLSRRSLIHIVKIDGVTKVTIPELN